VENNNGSNIEAILGVEEYNVIGSFAQLVTAPICDDNILQLTIYSMLRTRKLKRYQYFSWWKQPFRVEKGSGGSRAKLQGAFKKLPNPCPIPAGGKTF